MSNINSGAQLSIVEELTRGGRSLTELSSALSAYNIPKNTIRGSLTKLAKRVEVVRQGRTWYRATPALV